MNEGFVLIDYLGEIGCVFAGRNELVDRLVGVSVVVVVMVWEGEMGEWEWEVLVDYIFVVIVVSLFVEIFVLEVIQA